jgi:hypothetical protein
VIVDFLEGDPDRPIITGRVYNGTHRPPYALPAEKTKSTLKSNSSKGGKGFNEIRLEDKKGEEQIFVHAEKDQDIRVKHERFEWVGHDRHLVVKQDKFEHVEHNSHSLIDTDQFENIKHDRHLSVGGKQAISVSDSYSFMAGNDVIEIFKANHTEQTTNDYYLKAQGVVIEAASGITLQCGGSNIVVDPSGITLKGALVALDGGMVKIASGPGASPTAGTVKSAFIPAAPEGARDADTAHFKKPPPSQKKEAVDAHGGEIDFGSSVTLNGSDNGATMRSETAAPGSRVESLQLMDHGLRDARRQAQVSNVERVTKPIVEWLEGVKERARLLGSAPLEAVAQGFFNTYKFNDQVDQITHEEVLQALQRASEEDGNLDHKAFDEIIGSMPLLGVAGITKRILRKAPDKIPNTISRVDLSDSIGMGGEKIIYPLKSNENIVVGIHRDDYVQWVQSEGYLSPIASPSEINTFLKESLEAEVKGLNDLASAGIPVVKNHGIIDVGGTPGIVLDHIPGAISSHDAILFKNTEALKSVLNKDSISDLRLIESKLIKNNLSASDLQFLVRLDGRIFANDPGRVMPGVNPQNITYIRQLIELAE